MKKNAWFKIFSKDNGKNKKDNDVRFKKIKKAILIPS